MSLLEVRDLQVTYRSETAVSRPVDGVSLTINPREVVGLVGDAGSGKSTLALALLGLARAPGRITGGQVIFDGRDILTLPEDAARAIRPELGQGPWSARAMIDLPRALRTRVWRLLAVEAGSGAGQLSGAHVESLDALLTSWHGQGPLNLPGHVLARRSGDQVTLECVRPLE